MQDKPANNFINNKEIVWQGQPQLKPWLVNRLALPIITVFIIAAFFAVSELLLTTAYSNTNSMLPTILDAVRIGWFLVISIVIVYIFYLILVRNNIGYTLTNSDLTVQSGVISKSSYTVGLDQIINATVIKRLSDRLFGSNSATINITINHTEALTELENVYDPHLIIKQLQQFSPNLVSSIDQNNTVEDSAISYQPAHLEEEQASTSSTISEISTDKSSPANAKPEDSQKAIEYEVPFGDYRKSSQE